MNKGPNNVDVAVQDHFYELFDAAVSSGHKRELLTAFSTYFSVVLTPSLSFYEGLADRVIVASQQEAAAQAQTSAVLPNAGSAPDMSMPLLHSAVHRSLRVQPSNPYLGELYRLLSSFPPRWWADTPSTALGLRLLHLPSPHIYNDSQALAAGGGRQQRPNVLVTGVLHDGPAHAAGIVTGDVFDTVSGEPVRSLRDVRDLLGPLAAGDDMTITFWRDGSSTPLSAVVAVAGTRGELSGGVRIGAPVPAPPVQQRGIPETAKVLGIVSPPVAAARKMRLPVTEVIADDGAVWAALDTRTLPKGDEIVA